MLWFGQLTLIGTKNNITVLEYSTEFYRISLKAFSKANEFQEKQKNKIRITFMT